MGKINKAGLTEADRLHSKVCSIGILLKRRLAIFICFASALFILAVQKGLLKLFIFLMASYVSGVRTVAQCEYCDSYCARTFIKNARQGNRTEQGSERGRESGVCTCASVSVCETLGRMSRALNGHNITSMSAVFRNGAHLANVLL